MAVRQAASEFGDGGVVVGQLLLDRQRPPVRLQRLDRLAGLRLQIADVVVADRQAASEVGDGGVVVGQLLLDRQRPPVRLQRLDRLAGLRLQNADVVVAVRQAASESVTAGLSSASFCWIATARRYDSSASTGLPVCDCRMPMLLWVSARRLRNSVTAGLSSASRVRVSTDRW